MSASVLGVLFLSVLVLDLSSAHPLSVEKVQTRGEVVADRGRVDSKSSVVPCPDGEECPDGSTCCKTSEDKYACCSVSANAVCCADHTHCCQHGYTCGDKTCIRGFEVHPLVRLIDHLDAMPPPLRNIICPDGKEECPNGNTCCSIGNKAYGCCPEDNAVCCTDMKHCCPYHYICESTGCVKAVESHPLLQLVGRSPAEVQKSSPPVESVICPDEKSECPDDNTCCLKKGGAEYGCCPKKNAVCCTDGVHCCPEHYFCNSNGFCSHADSRLPFTQLVTSPVDTTTPPPLRNIICPGGKYECPDTGTCCPTASGEYGCCGISDAYCCSDMKHCCPKPYKCSDGKCVSEQSDHPLLQLVSAPLEKETPPLSVQGTECPDHNMYCPGSYTCCLMEGKSYGCCPQANATCCSDLKHCCAENYTCKSGKCSKSVPTIQLTHYQPSAHYSPPFICPDGKSECPYGYTCCMTASGVYGCCPKVNGVCCKDMIHCCPENYTCDAADGKCYSNYSTHPMLSLHTLPVPASSPPAGSVPAATPPPVGNIMCPGSKQECPNGSTCCSIGVDFYNCCPEVNAVCCSDKKHCCPAGYTCGDGKCLRVDADHPLLQLVPYPPSYTANEL